MKIFITGATGFIGTHLVRKLQNERHDLLLLTQKSENLSYNEPLEKVKIVTGNLSDISGWKNELKKFQPDATIHMAWEGIPNYDAKTSIKNLKYGLDLFTMLGELGCKRVISTGSCWEYGQNHGRLQEDMIPKPSNAFTIAKNALHLMGKEIAKENDMIFIWTRLFYVYGPGQKETSLIPHIINYIRQGKKPDIKTPSAKNDYIYAKDVVDAINMILKKGKQSTTYNIGSGHSISVKEIVNIVYDLLKIKNEFDLDSTSKNEDSFVDYWADISKIKMEIGWEPKIDINEGIRRLVSYYENQT